MGANGQAKGTGIAGPVSGRLNEFQRTMLQWNGLHPYNAVHVARVSARIAPDRLEQAIGSVLLSAGLTNYSVAARGGAYHYAGGESGARLTVIEAGDNTMATVHREMERQLNEAFPCGGTFLPFRFFLVLSGEESFVGLAYFHVVADAEAIGRLLLEILTAVFEGTGKGLRDGALAERRSSRGPGFQLLGLPGRLVAAFRKMQAMRRSFRSPDCPVNEFRNEWFGLSLDEAETGAVLALAKRQGVTVNDLCLAALLKAVVPTAAGRFLKRRQHLSAGCVVNLRRDLPEARRRDFGLFLGSFSVTHPVPPEIPLAGLLASVNAQTLAVKRTKLYLASAFEFRMNRFLFGRLPLEKQRNFYRKAYPVWGSITNFRMDVSPEGVGARILDYYRGVSAGPALPFVIGVTGFAGRLNLGFTYRPDVISGESVRAIAGRFIDLLTGKGETL